MLRWSCGCITASAFEQDQLWRYAADFKTKHRKATRREADPPGARRRRSGGVFRSGHLGWREDHLQQIRPRASAAARRDVERLRHYVCPHCGTPVGNREVAMKRLNDWLQGRPPQPRRPDFEGEGSASEHHLRGVRDSACRYGMTWSRVSPARRFSNECASMQEQSAIVTGQREQGTRAGRRRDLHRGTGGADQPGVQRERSRHRHGDRVQGRHPRGHRRESFICS